MGEPLRHDELMPGGDFSATAGPGGAWAGGAAVGSRLSAHGGQLRLLPDGAPPGTAVEAAERNPRRSDVDPVEAAEGVSAAPVSGPAVSLADYLDSLGPGAPCFACGAALLECVPRGGGAGSLACRRCGAGVETADRTAGEGSGTPGTGS